MPLANRGWIIKSEELLVDKAPDVWLSENPPLLNTNVAPSAISAAFELSGFVGGDGIQP